MIDLDRAVMVFTRMIVNALKIVIPLLGVFGLLYGLLLLLDKMGWIGL